jgi:hypothetical protein
MVSFANDRSHGAKKLIVIGGMPGFTSQEPSGNKWAPFPGGDIAAERSGNFQGGAAKFI